MLVFVGAYTRETDAVGISVFDFSEQTGRLEMKHVHEGIDNPSWLVRHPELPVLYAVGEFSDDAGSGQISAFHYGDDGKLELINRVSSMGADPCHLTLDHSGFMLVASNYTGGSFAAFSLDVDGTIGDMSSFIQHNGRGVDPMRQKGPHVHSALLSSDNYLYVADLGIDRLTRYPYRNTGFVDGNHPSSVRVRPGAGPRHFCFDAQERFVYLINELDNTITSFERDTSGKLVELKTVNALPDDCTKASYCAHIALSPDMKFLYGSNRGHDSIVVFSVEEDGELNAKQWIPSGGHHPRHFAIAPDGEHMIVANRDSHNLVVFNRDPNTGELTDAGKAETSPAPVCIAFG